MTGPHGDLEEETGKKELRILNEDGELSGHRGVFPNIWQSWIKSETLGFARSFQIHKLGHPYSTPVYNLAIINNFQLSSTYLPGTLSILSQTLPITLQELVWSHYTDLETEAESWNNLPKVTFTAGKRPSKEVNPDHSFPRHVPLPRAESQHLGFPDGSIVCFQKGKTKVSLEKGSTNLQGWWARICMEFYGVWEEKSVRLLKATPLS